MEANIIQGATGKNAADYYGAAAQIMAKSADREAQIMASQSAIAMNAVTGLTQSLTNGFMKAMEYSLAIKQADYAREMQLRNFQLQEEQMDMKRLQAQELVLNGQIERKAKLAQLAQMEMDRDNAGWKKMAMAQAAGSVSEIMTAATEYETGIGGQEALDRALALYKNLPELKRQALMRGVAPTEFAEMETQLAPLIRSLSFVKVGDREMRRADYQQQAFNLGTSSGQQAILASLNGTGPRDRLVDGEAAKWTEHLLAHRSEYTRDTASDDDALATKLLLAHGIKTPAPDQLVRAETLVRSFRTMGIEKQAELFVLAKAATNAEANERLQKERSLPGFDTRTWLSIANALDGSFAPRSVGAAGGADPRIAGWKSLGGDNSSMFTRKTIRGGEREVDTDTLVRIARNNQSLDAVATSDREKLIAGDYSSFDRDNLPEWAFSLSGAAGPFAASQGVSLAPGATALGVGAKLGGLVLGKAALAAGTGLGAYRVGQLIHGEAASAWRTATKDEEQAAASEILKEQLVWAASAPTAQQAVSRLASAKAFADKYRSDYAARNNGSPPTSFELLAPASFAFQHMAQSFRVAESTSGKAQLAALLASFDYDAERYAPLSRMLAAPPRSAAQVLGGGNPAGQLAAPPLQTGTP